MKDLPVPAVVRCRKRQQDVAPVRALSMSVRNGTSWSGRCRVAPNQEVLLQMESYAGLDWASDKHDVFVADAGGREAAGGHVRP
jgi:hypothetical protein